MSIRFITGKPGGGKSYTALRDYVIPELVRGKRNIVTNLDLDLSGLAQYLHDQHGETFDVRHRVRLLSTDEVSAFWTHYGQGETLEGKTPVRMPNGKNILHVDYGPRAGKPSVLYIIDEVHEYFNARHWQHTGDDALHYLSQHRKLGDDVVCITQSLGNVDKQFRSLGQDFSYIRNHGKESLPVLGGFFRSVGGFMRTTYLEPFTGNQSSVETRFYALDKKMAVCYRTAGGVGITAAGAADTKDERKGLHPSVLVLVLAAGAVAIWKAGNWGIHAVVKGVDPQPKVLKPLNEQSLAVPNPMEEKASVDTPHVVVASSTPTAPEGPEEDGLRVTGKVRLDGVWHVWLSDGRKITSADPDLKMVAPQYIILGKRRISF